MEVLGKSFVDLSFILIFFFFFFSFFLFCYCSFSLTNVVLLIAGSDRWLIVPRRHLLATPSLRLRFIFSSSSSYLLFLS